MITLSDIQQLLDSRVADLKDTFVRRMDELDGRLSRVEDHVQSAAADRAVIGLLERRVTALEEHQKAHGHIPVMASIAKWIAATGGAVVIVAYVTKVVG